MGQRLLISGRSRCIVTALDCKNKSLFSTTSISEGNGAEFGTGKKSEEEKLWLKFFSEPWEWWDHRLEKVNRRFPDFKHKKTEEALWLNSKGIPPWVEAKLATIAPNTFESGNLAWNHKLSRYAKAGQHNQVIEVYDQMQRDGIDADKYTYSIVLCACTKLGLLEKGRLIHRKIKEKGCELDLFVGSTLIDMYGKCGSLEEAETVFNKMPTKNVVTWNAMIRGYVKGNAAHQALELYQQMRQEGVDPDAFTFVQFLNACASVEGLQEGRYLHEEIVHRGYQGNGFVRNSLIDMYAKCGSMKDAELVLTQNPTRDVVAWTAMILGYVKCGAGQQALELYRLMQLERIDPDPVTLVAVLHACASLAALEEGKNVHEEIVRRGYDTNVVVENSLVDMYTKCGSIEDALRVFKQMSTRHVMAWTGMILGYVKSGQGWLALELYRQMLRERVDPDSVTFKAVLNACASVAALQEGRRVHEEIVRRGYEADVSVGNCLVDMYAKCGSIEDAKTVFDKMLTRDVVTWNSMLAGYGRHGYAKEAVEHFEQMCDAVEVNTITFISLLSACSHGGLVAVGLEYFKSMSTVYKISPTVDHYACVVDLLGRAGFLREAEDLILSMPIDPDAPVWMSLLGACRAHGLVEMGERCNKQVLELDPQSFAGQVLLSNIYVGTG